MVDLEVPAGGSLSASGVTAFIKLTRPVFLAGGVLMFAFGCVYALRQNSPLHLSTILLGQAMVTVIQLFAQYTNEYWDVDVDRINSSNRTWLTGGSGILPAGKFQQGALRKLLFVLAGCGLLLSLLAGLIRPGLILIGGLALLGSWAYSAPPLSLKSSGLGELAATGIVTVLVPLTGLLIHAERPSFSIFGAVAPVALMHWAMLIIFSFPDYQADRQAGKKTLAVRLGLPFTALFHSLLVALACGLAVHAVHKIIPTWALFIPIPVLAAHLIHVHLFARGWLNHKSILTTTALLLFTTAAFAGIVWAFYP